jgi:hypothetical protein
MENGFVIYLHGKVIGIFNNEVLANGFVDGGVQNNFFEKKHILIEKYVMNSCFLVKNNDMSTNESKTKQILVEIENRKKEIERKKIEDEKNSQEEAKRKEIELEKKKELEKRKELEEEIAKKKKEMENSEEFTKIQQDKIDLNQKINELKYEKKKMVEQEQEYTNNLHLYKKFVIEKEKDSNFNIPELFTLKFSVYNRLDKEDKLTFENYKEEWDKVKPKNNYDLFKSNNYEESFAKKDNDEEIIIDINI